MPTGKDSFHTNASVDAFTGKTLTGVTAYTRGPLTTIELAYSGGPGYIKVQGGRVEVGGTADWGTGVRQF